ncbi:MAG: hypothetical protein RBT69_09155 [Spirochaetia bacterium]|jgi:hypothetical protein|nr:hypothetical protein [Spirochaetia bacterium]
MKKHELTSMLVSYRKGDISRKTVFEAICLFVYKFPGRIYNWKEDDCSDFFSYFYPKIERMVDSFRIREVPFEVYLVKTLKLQIKTFAARKTAVEVSIKILKNKELWPYEKIISSSVSGNDFVCEPEPSPFADFFHDVLTREPSRINRENTLKKRLLMLALKNMQCGGDNEISRISALLDCDADWLIDAFSQLNEKRTEKKKKKVFLENRRNRHFSRLCLLHENSHSSLTPEEKEKIYLKIAKEKSSIDSLSKKLDMITVEPTHQDIAEVMKLPKGSVDSGLYYLKLYLENF